MTPQEMKTEWNNLVAELKNSVLTGNKEAIDKINARMDELDGFSESVQSVSDNIKSVGERLDSFELELKKRPGSPNDDVRTKREVAKEFTDAFKSFHQNDRQSLGQKTYNNVPDSYKSTNMVRFDFQSAGALVVPPQISDDMIRNVIESTPLMQLVRVTRTNSPEYKRRRRKSTPGGRWLGEEEANTKGKIAYDVISINAHEWAAQYGVSHQQLRDSAYDMVSEITTAFREDLQADTGSTYLNGNGVNKPTGMIGNITNFNATQLALSVDDLIKLQEVPKDAYQGNAQWLIERKTRANIRTQILAAGSDINGAWEVDLTRRTPTLLLGAPVNIAAPGDLAGVFTGNFTSGDVYAIYGDFNQGYEATIREDMYMIDDPYSEASTFVRNYHIMTSLGGGVIQSEALVQLTAAGS